MAKSFDVRFSLVSVGDSLATRTNKVSMKLYEAFVTRADDLSRDWIADRRQ